MSSDYDDCMSLTGRRTLALASVTFVAALVILWRLKPVSVRDSGVFLTAENLVRSAEKPSRVYQSTTPSLSDLADATLDAGSPEMSPKTVQTRFLGERVAASVDCEKVCGAACVNATDGTTHCGRTCTHDDECDADSICHPTTTGVGRCAWSQCLGVGAEGCQPGWTCLPFFRASGAVFLCAKAGTRMAGASCLGIGNSHSTGLGLCGPGLFCTEGTCLPARCQRNSDCLKGSRCEDVTDHQQCVAACDSDADCKAGMQCTEHPQGRKACANLSQASCVTEGCKDGLKCFVTLPLLTQLHAECLRDCSANEPCSVNESCIQNSFGETVERTCRKTCTPSGEPCQSGSVCVGQPAGPAICLVAVDATIELP